MSHIAPVVEKSDPGPDLVRLTLAAPGLARTARPGQFVMVRTSDTDSVDPLLRRPLSIHDVRGDKLSLLFKVIGRGTANLARLERGGEVDLLGPLGRPFPEVEGPALLIGGGLGIAPLLFLARGRAGRQTAVRLGAATAAELVVAMDFEALAETHLFTEDGSTGEKGLVTAGLADELAANPAAVLTCGPEPMLRAVAGAAAAAGVECHVSLEARMACGLGACLGCSVDRADGGRARVCLEGPVFEAERIFGEFK